MRALLRSEIRARVVGPALAKGRAGGSPNMFNRTLLLSSLTTLAALALMSARPALANEDDEAACEGLGEGSPCVDGDGEAGQCLTEPDDPVLSCEEMDFVVCVGQLEGAACTDGEGVLGACLADPEDGELSCEADEPSEGSGGGPGTGGRDVGGNDAGGGDTGGAGTGGAGTGTGNGGSGGTPHIPNGSGGNSSANKDGDELACASLAEGDACTEEDGDAGFCVPDDSDPNVLECDDDGASSASSSSLGCSTAASGAAGGGAFALLALVAAVGVRRRPRR